MRLEKLDGKATMILFESTSQDIRYALRMMKSSA
jgi:hypothetical protein